MEPDLRGGRRRGGMVLRIDGRLCPIPEGYNLLYDHSQVLVVLILGLDERRCLRKTLPYFVVITTTVCQVLVNCPDSLHV